MVDFVADNVIPVILSGLIGGIVVLATMSPFYITFKMEDEDKSRLAQGFGLLFWFISVGAFWFAWDDGKDMLNFARYQGDWWAPVAYDFLFPVGLLIFALALRFILRPHDAEYDDKVVCKCACNCNTVAEDHPEQAEAN